MSSTSPIPATSGPEAAFLGPLAAGLPASHDWTFPSLVGVSGGGDSVALLLGLMRLAPGVAASRLVVAHADHGLRAESADDRDFVRKLSENLGLRVISRRLDVAREGGGKGLEGRARHERYAFLAEVAHEIGARHVMVAHTADDQAETILHRILRGTGVAGLAGMRRARLLANGVSLLRPLLRVPRGTVRDFLTSVAEDWREDQTNRDTARARNFLRHEVLPRCTSGPYPAARAAVCRLGEQAGAVSDALASAAEHILEFASQRRYNGTLVIKTGPLLHLDRLLLAEIFVALWRREGWPRQDMTAAHYATLAGFVGGVDDQALTAVRQFPGAVTARVISPGLLALGRE